MRDRFACEIHNLLEQVAKEQRELCAKYGVREQWTTDEEGEEWVEYSSCEKEILNAPSPLKED